MKKNGSVIFALIFMFLVLFVGFSLLNFTLIHNRVVKARNIHNSRSELLHNHLIVQLHRDTEKIKSIRFDSAVDEYIEIFNNTLYPDIYKDPVKIKRSFQFNTRDLLLFKLTKVNFRIESISSNGRHKWISESIFNIISGDIPFDLFPVLINSGQFNRNREAFIENHLASTEKHNIFISDNESVFDIKSYLAMLLGLDREDLTLETLNKLFKQANNGSEFMDGIYLSLSEENTGPVFVQGNTEKIILSVEEKYQIIEIVQNNNYFKIRYSGDQFEHKTGGSSLSEYKKFNEKIIVNGNVEVLEAGSDPALAIDSYPELIILGNLNICSSITGSRTNVLKNSKPSITILLAPSPFLPNPETPSLRFYSSKPLIIHGSINIKGSIFNKAPEVHISGNLYCFDIMNKSNIEVTSPNSSISPSINNFFIKDLTIIKGFRTESTEEIFEDEK